jgi:hypothetical protein
LSQQKSKPNKKEVALITVISLVAQSLLYLWLYEEVSNSTGALGGLILIPAALAVGVCILIHLILCLFSLRKYWIPLVATLVLWTVGIGTPILISRAETQIDNAKGMAIEEAQFKTFRDHLEPLLKKKYKNVAWMGRYLQVQDENVNFMVGCVYSDPRALQPYITLAMDTPPSETDTSFWLEKVELIRPILNEADSKLLDSIKSRRALQIYSNLREERISPLDTGKALSKIRPRSTNGYPLHITVEFMAGKRFLFEEYQAHMQGAQFRISLCTPIPVRLPED